MFLWDKTCRIWRMKRELQRLRESVAPEKIVMLVRLIYVLWLREQFAGPEPKWGNLQDSSQAVLLLPPVLHREENLSKKGLRTPISYLPPCRHVPGGTMNVPPGLPAAFPHQTQGSHSFFCFPSSTPIKIPPVPRWLPGYVVHGTA